MTTTIYKTRIDSFDKCSRYGYLKYMFLGRGVEADHRGLEMAVGGAVHEGVDSLWRGEGLASAVATAHLQHDFEVSEGLYKLTDPQVINQVQREQRAVIEGVLTLWALARLPVLLNEYDYVNSEYKIITPLTPELNLYARPDAIIQAKFDNRFLNWSLKTEKSHGRIKHPSALIDTGGLTENISAAMSVGNGKLTEIAGTMMEYIVVGELSKKEPIIWHPTIRGWRRPSPAGAGFDYAWRWEFPNPDYDPNGPVSSHKNPGNRSLAKKDGWERFDAENYTSIDGAQGITAWVRDLVARAFIPYHVDPLAELVRVPLPYDRSASVVESFIKQTIGIQARAEAAREGVEAGTIGIDTAFPQNRTSCLRYGESYRCEMWDICWEGAGVDPFNRGYRARLSSTEREARKIAFLIDRVKSNTTVEEQQ